MIWDIIKKNWIVYLLGILIPFGVWVFFIGYPLVYNIYLSFTDWNGFATNFNFVGLHNYHDLLNETFFYKAFYNTMIWLIVSLLITVILSFSLALILNSKKIYFSNFFRALLFLPYTMPLVTIGVMFSLLLSPGFGALDMVLKVIGLGDLIYPWLGDYNKVIYTLIVIFCWSYIGLPIMLFHAGLNQIPKPLYEAALLEGAKPIQILWYITIPLLRSVFIVVIMLTVIQALRTFDLVAVTTEGGPFGASTVLGFYMYRQSFWNSRFGYGAAIGVIILLMSSVFSLLYLRRTRGDILYDSKR